MTGNKSGLTDKDIFILNSYQYAKGKVSTLPEGVRFIGGELDLRASCVDMIPAGLKGIDSVYFSVPPKFIAPDYTGEVLIDYLDDPVHPLDDLKKYKDRYVRCQKFVEMPRYFYDRLCTLPNNMHFFKAEDGYCLDLSKTSVRYASAISGISRIIFEHPLEFFRPDFPNFRPDFPKKISRHKDVQLPQQKTKTKE